MLFKPAWESKDTEKRYFSVEKLDDEDILNKIARSDTEDKIAELALSKITNQSLISEIAKDTKAKTQLRAILRVADINVLSEIASTDTYFEVLGDNFQSVADGNYPARNCALKAIINKKQDQESQNTLAYIYKTSKNLQIQKTAAAAISNPKILEDLVCSCINSSQNYIPGIEYLVKNIEEQQTITKLMKKCEDKNKYIFELLLNQSTDSDAIIEFILEENQRYGLYKKIAKKLIHMSIPKEYVGTNFDLLVWILDYYVETYIETIKQMTDKANVQIRDAISKLTSSYMKKYKVELTKKYFEKMKYIKALCEDANKYNVPFIIDQFKNDQKLLELVVRRGNLLIPVECALQNINDRTLVKDLGNNIFIPRAEKNSYYIGTIPRYHLEGKGWKKYAEEVIKKRLKELK